MAKTDTAKRKNKSKEEIAYDMKMAQETQRKREFISEKFFPLLQTHTFHRAKQICKVLHNDILSTFNEGMRNQVSTLALEKKIEGDDSESAMSYKAFLDIFKDMTISEAAEIIGGMPQAIEGALMVEDRTRSMSELVWDNGAMKIKDKETIEDVCKRLGCNDFRQLGSGNWVAYSTKVDEKGVAYRGFGVDLRDALSDLEQKSV